MKLTGKRWKKQFLLFINTSIYTINTSIYITALERKTFPKLARKMWDYLRMKELEENT